MSCASRVNLQRGTVEVDGDSAAEVQQVLLSVTEHLRLFAVEHPSILREAPAVTEVTMGDRYEVHATAAAVGPGASLSMDMRTVEVQLNELRAALRAIATTPQDDLELAAIAEAQLAAQASDERGVLNALKRVGARAIDMAQEIGVTVATAAISRALGL